MKRVFQVILGLFKKLGLRLSFILGFHLDINRSDEQNEQKQDLHQITMSAGKDENTEKEPK